MNEQIHDCHRTRHVFVHLAVLRNNSYARAIVIGSISAREKVSLVVVVAIIAVAMYRTTSKHQEFILPPDRPNQTYVSVSALAGGFITIPDKALVSPSDPHASRTVPSLSFLITHPGHPDDFGTANNDGDGDSNNNNKDNLTDPLHLFASKKTRPGSELLRIMFDLGLRSSPTGYSTPQRAHLETRRPYDLSPGVARQLSAAGIEPSEIDAVLYSHVHYDHHGDPNDFPNALFIVGKGSLDVLEHGLQGKGSHQHFDPGLLPSGRSTELPGREDGRWTKGVGPFDAALDLLGDGSLYAVDTPGHLPGHTNLLCRVGPERWVCLCGDAYHDRRILTGEKEIGSWKAETGDMLCIHLDPQKARESIKKLRSLEEVEGVELIAAHDEIWWKEAERDGRVFPSIL